MPINSEEMLLLLLKKVLQNVPTLLINSPFKMASKKKQENVETEEIEESVQTIPKPNISNIRNKILRNEAYKKLKKEKKKVD